MSPHVNPNDSFDLLEDPSIMRDHNMSYVAASDSLNERDAHYSPKALRRNALNDQTKSLMENRLSPKKSNLVQRNLRARQGRTQVRATKDRSRSPPNYRAQSLYRQKD